MIDALFVALEIVCALGAGWVAWRLFGPDSDA